MSDTEEDFIYKIVGEPSKDPIYNDLRSSVRIFTIDKFKEFVIDKAVVLLDAKEDMINFVVKTIDDDIELLKEYNKDKKFVVFSDELLTKVTEDQEFYTIIIQPYLIVQVKTKRDEFISEASAQLATDDQEDEEAAKEQDEETSE